MHRYSIEDGLKTLPEACEMIKLLEIKLNQEFKLKQQMKQCDKLLSDNIIMCKTIYNIDELHQLFSESSKVIQLELENDTNLNETSTIKIENVTTSELPLGPISSLNNACLKIIELKSKLFQLEHIKEIIQSVKQNIIVFENIIRNILLVTNNSNKDLSSSIQMNETSNIVTRKHLYKNEGEKQSELVNTTVIDSNLECLNSQSEINQIIHYNDPLELEDKCGVSMSSIDQKNIYRYKQSHKKIQYTQNLTKQIILDNMQIRINAAQKYNNKYICDICDKIFIEFSKIRRHILSVHNKITKCKLCDTNWSSCSCLYRKPRDKMFSCDVCGVKFTSLITRKKHRIKMHETSDAVHFTKHDLMGNIKIRINAAQLYNDQYFCDICQKTFGEFKKLRMHILNHRKLQTCKTCGKKYATLAHLRKHEIFHINKEARGTLYFCDICTNKFYTKSGLKYHMMKHNPNSPHKCKICNKSFSRNAYLNYHMMKHNGVDKPFKCNKCKQTYFIMSALKRHIEQSHNEIINEWNNKIKHFVCEMCGLKFLSANSLTQHQQTHLKKKYFTCKTCSKQFLQKQNLCAHIREYHLTCEICNKHFVSMGNLHKHSVIHQSIKPYKCDLCFKEFAQKGTLNFHLKVHAGLKPYAKLGTKLKSC